MATIALPASAALAANPGGEIIDMGVGEPDEMAFPEVVDELHKEARKPENRGYADNGDATSLVSFQSPERDAYNGLALVIVRAKPGQAGNIILKAKADGLESCETKIAARK